MKFYNILIKFRFYIGLFTLALAILVNVTSGFWPSFILYLAAVVAIASHFFIGPLRLIQEPMENGKMDEVQKIIDSIWFPNLLFKPIRSTYFTIKGNIAMMNQDFTTAEAHLKKSGELGSAMPEAEGANKLQLGMMALQRNDFKQGEAYIRAAIRLGIPDKESEAMAYLAMTQIFMRKSDRNSLRAAKEFYRKAKDCKPKSEQIVEQLKQMNQYISRIPG